MVKVGSFTTLIGVYTDRCTEKLSAAQHNAAFSEWHAEHGDDSEAVQALLTEHAKILAEAPQSSRSNEVQKRVSAIAVQMADMVSVSTAVLPTHH